jgi:taurine dioxygenase
MSQVLDIRPLSEHCGAEIAGVDLTDLSSETLRTLKATLAERGVVFLHDQHLTPEQHIAFARRWGEIDINRFFPTDSRYPEVAEVRKDEAQTTNIGGGWHTDHSYDPEPAMGSILLARETPPTGGDTLFSSMYAAYDSLSDGLKQTLSTLSAVHSADHIYGPDGAYAKTDLKSVFKGLEERTFAVHPVVITHPDSGRKALYVNPAFTLRIEGWTRDESLALLGYLYAQAIRPEFVCTLKWRPGSLAIWDNRSTWHLARNDYQGHRRLMHRITIAGCALAA